MVITALILLALFPPLLAATDQSMYGYGIFTVGVVILELSRALKLKRILKAGLLTFYLFSVSFLCIGLNWAGFSRALFSGLLVVALRFAAWYLERSAQAWIKPKLSLQECGLSPAEAAYVRAAAVGITYKEIAANARVSESTVRNTLARAFRKLGVNDKAALVSLIDAHELED